MTRPYDLSPVANPQLFAQDFASAVDVVKRIIDLTPAATPQPVPDHHH